MKDLLKEAIADAKAVRETALANAKLALEEAFTPRLQSMLSAKLAEEMSEEDEDMTEGDEYADNTPTFEEGEEGEETMDSEEAMDTDSDEEEMSDEEMPEEGEDDLDLDEIIKELEMEEDMDSSEIGMGDNEMDEYGTSTENDDEMFAEGEDEMSDDEEVDINEIIRSLREEDEEEETMDSEEESSSEDLEEAYNVIKFLKSKINEVNLLNAKLLYSNKLFRNFTLNENQKMKVIENFDRAHSLREVKLVFSTLAEGFKMPATKKVVKESFASKPTASTKPARKQVISEGADLAARFKKLAGLK
jgi:hypothetical protein